MDKRSGRGFSLIEIVTSMTILFIGCFFVFRMFLAAVHYSGTISNEVIACILAQRRIEEIRGWAYRDTTGSSNFTTGDWSIFNSSTTDPIHAQFNIRTDVSRQPLISPSSSLQPGKFFEHSAMCVKVEVSWRSGVLPKNVTLITIIGEPYRKPDYITLDSDKATPITLGANQKVKFTAKGFDNNNREINDITFHWSVLPVTANGTVTPLDNFRKDLDFKNSVNLINGGTSATNGVCRVNAILFVGGKVINQPSEIMHLTNP